MKMYTLAFDGTAKVASVAVGDDDRIIALYSIDNGLTQSELLLPMAEDMLRSLGLSFSDIGLFATSVGPGSFTGVRIGVSLVKGLAFGRGIPCVGISTLDALAENLKGLSGILVPCMDARRSQVYTAIYSSDGERIEKLTDDMAISISELRDRLASLGEKDIYLSGDGYDTVKKVFSSLGFETKNTPKELRLENAASVARIAYEKYLSGEYTTDTELSPTYLRLPQAERERLERLNEEQGETK